MERTVLHFPRTDDPLGLIAAIIRHLQKTFDAEVRGYDADLDGSVTVDLRLRVGGSVEQG